MLFGLIEPVDTVPGAMGEAFEQMPGPKREKRERGIWTGGGKGKWRLRRGRAENET